MITWWIYVQCSSVSGVWTPKNQPPSTVWEGAWSGCVESCETAVIFAVDCGWKKSWKPIKKSDGCLPNISTAAGFRVTIGTFFMTPVPFVHVVHRIRRDPCRWLGTKFSNVVSHETSKHAWYEQIIRKNSQNLTAIQELIIFFIRCFPTLEATSPCSDTLIRLSSQFLLTKSC